VTRAEVPKHPLLPARHDPRSCTYGAGGNWGEGSRLQCESTASY